LSETFFILRRIRRDVTINLHRLHVKYQLFWSGFNETRIFSTYFRNIHKYQISRKSAQLEPSCFMRTDGQTDTHEEANISFSRFFCDRTNFRHLEIRRRTKSQCCSTNIVHYYLHAHLWYCGSQTAETRCTDACDTDTPIQLHVSRLPSDRHSIVTTIKHITISCASACKTNTTQTQPQQISNTQRTENKMTDVVIHQHSRKLLMMDTLMSEIC